MQTGSPTIPLNTENIPVPMFISKTINNLLSPSQLNAIYNQIESEETRTFLTRLQEEWHMQIEMENTQGAFLTSDKPLIFVAPYSFSGMEALFFAKEMNWDNNQIKIAAHPKLEKLPQAESMLLSNSVYGTSIEEKKDKMVDEACAWLQQNKHLFLFLNGNEAGDRFNLQAHISTLLKQSQAQIVPLHFTTQGNLENHFKQLVSGAISKTDPLNAATPNILQIKCGQAIKNSLFSNSGKALPQILHLLSALQAESKEESAGAVMANPETVVRAMPKSNLHKELSQLPTEALLVEKKGLQVYMARANHIPLILNEIARCREITYRNDGHGSGKSLFFEPYDRYYNHLFIWDAVNSNIVGAFRVGRTDQILPVLGRKGLCTHASFKLKKKFISKMAQALELSHNFIMPAYRNKSLPFALLWQGMGAFMRQNPQYRYLFGQVRIEHSYSPLSQAVIKAYMQSAHAPQEWKKHVKAWEKGEDFTFSNVDTAQLHALFKQPNAFQHLNVLLASLHQPGGPKILKHFIALGAHTLAFGNRVKGQLDMVCLLDVMQAPKGRIKKYFGPHTHAALEEIYSG